MRIATDTIGITAIQFPSYRLEVQWRKELKRFANLNFFLLAIPISLAFFDQNRLKMIEAELETVQLL